VLVARPGVPARSLMSCLPSDAFSHFERREQELLALNQELDHKRANAITEASNAVRDAESSSLHGRVYRPPEDVPAATASAPSASAADDSLLSSSRPGTGSRRSLGVVGAEFGDAAPSEALHATVRCQNMRIVALQEELDKHMAELTAREEDNSKLKKELKQATDEVKRLQKEKDKTSQSEERSKKQSSSLESKVQDLERERAEIMKERDQLEIQKKKADAEASKQEAKLNRLSEECVNLKAHTKESKTEDKDRAVTDRRETERLTAEVRKLERQRTELVGAFKKQMKLIEVLKRQRAHIEAARVLSFTEDEFIRVLELGDKLGD